MHTKRHVLSQLINRSIVNKPIADLLDCRKGDVKTAGLVAPLVSLTAWSSRIRRPLGILDICRYTDHWCTIAAFVTLVTQTLLSKISDHWPEFSSQCQPTTSGKGDTPIHGQHAAHNCWFISYPTCYKHQFYSSCPLLGSSSSSFSNI